MTLASTFLIALTVSYIGSIPPGSINITTLQYALNGKKRAALTFAFAASFVEFFYAGFAVKFQLFLTENQEISLGFRVITGVVLLILGVHNLAKTPRNTNSQAKGEKRSALVKGLVIAVSNPLAIPFWLVVTAYLSTVGWISLNNDNYLFYILGVSSGTFLLLLTVTSLGSRFEQLRHNPFVMYKIPGIMFILMGVWTFVKV